MLGSLRVEQRRGICMYDTGPKLGGDAMPNDAPFANDYMTLRQKVDELVEWADDMFSKMLEEASENHEPELED